MNDKWIVDGPVEVGQYPFTYLGYGVATATGQKVALATSLQLAELIVSEHNCAQEQTGGAK